MPTRKDYDKALARLAKAEAMLAAHELDVEAATFLYTEQGQPVYQPQDQQLTEVVEDSPSEADELLTEDVEEVQSEEVPQAVTVGYSRPNRRTSPVQSRGLNQTQPDIDKMSMDELADHYEKVARPELLQAKGWRV